MKYNPEINHRKSIRIKKYDYAQSGFYFITICTLNRENLFGEINGSKMVLNHFGKIVEDCIKNIPKHFLNTDIDYFVVMPNHIHLVVIIDDHRHSAINCRDTACRVPTESFGKPVAGSLPTIIRSLKSAITKQINIIRNMLGIPVWQRNYFEHIIRNEKELHKIRKYIEYNPLYWNQDEYNK